MSVLGTGVAAGVAQTSLQAQQVARRRDKRARETEKQAQHVREVFEAHIKGLEENDTDETTARLHVDSQLNDHEDPVEDATAAPRQDSLLELTRSAQEIASQTVAARSDQPVVADSPAPTTPQATRQSPDAKDPHQLYQHLDVKA